MRETHRQGSPPDSHQARVVHYQYTKLPLGEGQDGWQVEDAGFGFRPRELVAYGKAAVLHAHELIDLIPAIQSEIGGERSG